VRTVHKGLRMAAVVVIALVGCASNFAGIDWDDNPDTPDAADIVTAQPATLETQILLRKQAQIPRQIDRSDFASPMSIVGWSVMPSLQNFYFLRKDIRERAPPPLVQRK
jgi:hypothetical protein